MITAKEKEESRVGDRRALRRWGFSDYIGWFEKVV